jgi:DNA-binding CsgD family transcriptional regulator
VGAVTDLDRRQAVAGEAGLLVSLRESMCSIDGDASYFMMRTRDGARRIHHLLLGCDPRWAFEYSANDCSLHDPWFRYAIGNSAPVLAADVFCDSRREREVVDLAAKYGFADAALFPAPSPQGRSRIGLLVIGAQRSNVRSSFRSAGYRAAGRDIAMSLHERWMEMLRGDFVRSSELSTLDLRILELELQGWGTKAIARHLRTTDASVNSRVQRLTNKLRVPNRRAAALRALEFGMICLADCQETLFRKRT